EFASDLEIGVIQLHAIIDDGDAYSGAGVVEPDRKHVDITPDPATRLAGVAQEPLILEKRIIGLDDHSIPLIVAASGHLRTSLTELNSKRDHRSLVDRRCFDNKNQLQIGRRGPWPSNAAAGCHLRAGPPANRDATGR